MGFNPTWPGQYQPTATKDTWKIVDNIGQYSDSGDTISTQFSDADYPEALRGLYILLHSGSDQYYGTDYDSPGWDNVVNGNKGDDNLWGYNASRDFLRGGKDNDYITGQSNGNDFLLGDAGDDRVFGSVSGNNIVRGGKGNDYLQGGTGDKRDLLLGDFGKDAMRGGGGSDFFVLRSDTSSSSGLSNLTPNAAEADIIKDFKSDDYLVFPGITTNEDVRYQWDNGNYLVRVRTDSDFQYAAVLESVGLLDLPTTPQTIVGQKATDILAAADGDSNAFGNNPNLLNSFGI